MQTVYEAAGGDEGLLRLASAWHARVMADEVVSHAFSHGFHPEHSERLAAYWAEALGGPTTYSDAYGDETSVVRIHSGNGPHEEMDRRAIACFDQALTDVAISENDPVRAVLHDYFAWATITTMSRVSPVRGRCSRWVAHAALVLGRPTQLSTSTSVAMPRPTGRKDGVLPARRAASRREWELPRPTTYLPVRDDGRGTHHLCAYIADAEVIAGGGWSP